MRGAHPLRPLDTATCWTPWVAGSALNQFSGLLAAVLLASGALTAALARPVFAQQQETATLHWGGTVVWLRATDEANVLVFASPGYRNAFARPTILSADEADQWATLIERLEAPPTARSTGLRVTDSTRAALAEGDLLIEPAPSTAGAALRMRLSATRPDGITTMLFPDGAPAAAAALHDAARVARHLHDTVLAAAGSAAIPAPAPSASPTITTASRPIAPPAVPPSVAGPAVVAPTTNAPPVAPTQLAAAVPATPPQPAAPSMAAAPTTAPPAVATHGPTVRVVAVQSAPPAAAAPTIQITGPASTTTPSAAPVSTVPSAPSVPAAVPAEVAAATPASTPVAAGASVTPAPASPPRLRVARPSFVAPVPPRQATAPAAPVTAAAPATTPAVPATTAHPSVLAAVTIRTNTTRLTQRNGVDNATVMNLVRQWQPDLTYCYTEYGLRNHPGLYGSVLVRMTIAPQGTVSHVEVARRKWSDDGATEVEACVRSRVAAWYFPPAAVSSVHQFPLTFSR